MKIYDVFAEEFITENEIDPIAPPERYIYIDDDPIIYTTSKYEVKIKNSIDIDNIIL